MKKIIIAVAALCLVAGMAFADHDRNPTVDVAGIALQGSISMTDLGHGRTQTEGLAAQGSIGIYHGELEIQNHYNNDLGKGQEPKNVVGFEMKGETWSFSYQDRECHSFTQGTEVGARTKVESFAPVSEERDRDRDRRRDEGVSGGYIAGGVVATQTMDHDAYAGAAGAYAGAGSLGSTFIGSAKGYSETQTSSNHGKTEVGSYAGMAASAKSNVTK